MKRLIYITIVLCFVGCLFSACRKAYETVPLGQQITLDLAFDPRDSLGKQAMTYLLTTYQQAFYNGHKLPRCRFG
jgi:starch-binding outer membrane protein, SusD/RagB family